MNSGVRLVVPLDRLDGRRHTFGTYLTGWLKALRPLLDGLTVTRKRKRSYPRLEDFAQACIPRLLEGNRAYSLLFPLWVRRFEANIIHFPYRFAPYAWWGLEAKKVVTVHDTALLSLPDELVSRMRKRTLWRYRRTLAGFDAVVTVSEASRAELCRHYGLTPAKVRVIRHGVDVRFTPGTGSADLASRYGVEEPYILNVSSIKRKKNIAGLVRAFALLKRSGYPHRLVLVGKPDDGLDEVTRAVAETGTGNDVIITGFVDEKDHPDFYRRADLLVYPSFYEGFGLPILEAMACGCPVVAADASSMPEVSGDAALLVDPRDTEGIHRAMRAVLDDRALREALVAKGIRRAAAFTWEKSAAAHLELYRELLGSRPWSPEK